MNLLQEFKNYLFSQEVKPSKVTVKNYLSDINHFIRWFEKSFQKPFSPTEVTKHVIENYKIESSESFSVSSIERHLSSLRKFFNFLILENLTSIDPFKPFVEEAVKDPWHIKDFKSYLYVFNASHLTIKNYLIDIKQFLNWAEEVTGINNVLGSKNTNVLNHINSNLIEEYKQRLISLGTFSPATINRKLSSLRKYVLWIQAEGLISPISLLTNNVEEKIKAEINAPSILDQKEEPVISHPPSVTTYSSFPPYRLFQKVTKGIVLAIDATLIAQIVNLIERAESIVWKTKGESIFTQAKKIRIPNVFTHEDLLGVKNIKKELYAPLEISTKYFPWYKKAWFTLRYKRPKWYKTYHSYAIVHYFHFAILVIFVAGLAFGFYNGFVQQGSKSPTLAANLPTNPPRILSFQGRLTDNNDNPITSGTNLRFAIYRDSTASGSALLWQEVNRVNPDTDGIFNAILGNTTTIPQSLFSENNALWLGVTVETTSELTPRQQLATVAFAANSETLQGLLPITATAAGTTNVVLALNSSGNLVIGGSATPTFQASGGQFTLSGQALLLTTNAGTNGNVQLSPDGLGKIDLNKPIVNTSLNNNIGTAVGSVEVDDLFSILATSSGQSAFTLNQAGAGPLISASASGTNRFAVDNSGNIKVAAGTTIDTFTAGSLGFGFTNANAINIGNSGATLALSFTGLTSNQNSVLYAGASGNIGTVTTTSSGLCLVSVSTPGNPSWTTCPGSNNANWWNQLAGALSPLNTTNDFLLGSTATSSALFSYTGIKTGQTIASLSGQLIVMPNNGWGGQVGIGTTTPISPLTIKGSNDSRTLGSELVTNGTFTTCPGTWGFGLGWGCDGIKANHSATSSGNLSQAISITAGKTYQVTYSWYTYAGNTGGAIPYLGGTAGTGFPGDPDYDSSGTITTYIVAGSSGSNIIFTADAAFGGYIDNVSVKLLSDSYPLATLQNSDGTAAIEMRSGGTEKQNTLIGVNAGKLNFNGTNLTTLGVNALANNLNGLRNIAVGNSTLQLNTDGNDNNAFGYNALYSNLTGNYNSAFGNYSLNSNTGSNNTAMGYQAGKDNTSNNNAFFGYNAGLKSTTGSDNTYLGTNAGANTSGGLATNTGSGNTYVGVGAGIVSYNANSTGSYNSFLGVGAGNTPGGGITGNFNTFLGSNAGNLFGRGAPAALSGTSNVFIGYYAGGQGSGGALSGSYNVFLGDHAGKTITSGNYNIFLGFQAGDAILSGSNNIALGQDAGGAITNGTNNTFIGYRGGVTNIAGGLNTTYGYSADVGSGHLINATAIGANAYVNQNDSLVLGSINGVNSATGSARIGIGIINPAVTFDVRGFTTLNAGTLAVASISGLTSFASLVVNNDGVGDLFTASKSGLPIFTIRNNGQLTLGAPYYTAGCTALETNSAGTVVCGVDDSGGGVNWWNQLAGALSPVDTTNDLLLGSTATSSALFSFTGVKTGQTIASASGNLIVMPNNGWGGQVGIGITNPAAKLDVAGNSLFRDVITAQSDYRGTYGIGGGGLQTSAGALAMQSWNTSIVTGVLRAFASQTADILQLQNSSGTVLSKFDSSGNLSVGTSTSPTGGVATFNGNVGIGTTSPIGALDVKDFNARTGTQPTNLTMYVTGNLQAGAPSQTGNIEFRHFNGTQGIGFGYNTIYAAGSNASQDLGFSSKGPSSNLIFSINSVEKARFDTNGNFGIGTSPTALLDVAGAASVGGQLTFRSGTAQIQSTVNQALTLGGNTTGNITLAPLNGAVGGNVVPSVNQQTDLGTSGLQWRNIYAQNFIGGTTGIQGLWQRTSGSLAPTNITDSLNLGAVATSSALVHLAGTAGENSFINTGNVGILTSTINTNTNVDINGNLRATRIGLGTNPDNSYALFASGTVRGTTVMGDQLQTVASGAISTVRLIIDSPSGQTGDLTQWKVNGTTLSVINASGNLGIGTTSPTAPLHIAGAYGSNAAEIINQLNSGDIFTASASGTTKFTIGNTGAITDAAYTNAGGILYTSTTGLIGQTAGGTSAQCLTGGTTPGWSSCSSAASNFWQRNAGALSPLTSSDDFLLGSNATSTAAFAFTGLKGNQTQASFSGQFVVMPNNGYGGNVGIGTTTPVYSLDVNGRINASGDGNTGTPDILFNGAGGFGYSSGQVRAYKSDNILGWYWDASNINTVGLGLNIQNGSQVTQTSFPVSGNSYINNGGNVGIGTTSPTALLDVAGNATSSGALTFSATTPTINYENGGALNFRRSVGGDAGLTSTMYLDAGGNVGIGTTSPLTALDVTGSASISANLSLRGAATAHTFNILDNGTLNIQRSPGGDAGLATALFIQNNGNVGIGLINPGNKLAISGSSGGSVGEFIDNTNTAGYAVLRLNSGNADVAVGLTLHSFGSTYGGAGAYTSSTANLTGFDSGGLTLAASNASGTIKFYTAGTAAVNERMRIDTNGNVGIGTTSPTALLDVAGAASVGGQLTFRSGFGTIQTTANQGLTLGGNTTGDIQFKPGNSSSSLYLQSTGNVGIGTTAPGAKLDVSGGLKVYGDGGILGLNGANMVIDGAPNNYSRLEFRQNAGATHYGYIQTRDASTNNVQMEFATANTIRMVIGGANLNGNVGINTLTPTAYLDVVGTASVGGQLTFRSGFGTIQSTVNQVLTIGGNTTGNITLAPINGLTSAFVAPNTNNQVDLGISSLAWRNVYGQNFISSGTTGIQGWWQRNLGALSPTNITDDLLLGGQSTASADFAFIGIAGAGTPTASISGNLSLAVPTGANPAALFNIFNGGSLNFQTSVGGNAGLTTRLFIANNGNIGIGTTNPQAKLDIGGSSSTITNSSGDITITPTANLIVSSGKVGINATSPLSTLDVRGNTTNGGTISVASISGRTSFAALVANNDGVGDLFTASSSGTNKFTVKRTGELLAPAYATCTLKTDASGLFTCGTDNTGGSGNSPFAEITGGVIVPNNSTVDFLVGGQSSTSAEFAVLNVAGTRGLQTASLSGSLTLDSTTASIQTTKNQLLTIGGNTTGDIQFKPGNSSSSLYLQSTGNVGIGTTNLGSNELVVQKDQNGWTSILSYNATNGTNAGGEFLAKSLTSTGYMSAYSSNYVTTNLADRFGVGAYTDTAGLDLLAEATTGDIRFYTGGLTTTNERMRINSSGNVGINTTSPTALLHLNGGNTGGNAAFIVNQTGNSANDIFTASASGTTQMYLTNGGSIYARSFYDLDQPAYFLDPAATGTSFTTLGSVGIGTASPQDKLHVAADINANFPTADDRGQIRITGTTNTNLELQLGFDTTDEYGYIRANKIGVSTRALSLQPDGGSIGIGTTSPTTTLDITGSASISANFGFRGAATAHTFNILDNGTLNIQRSPSGDAGLATALFIQNNGNVGIGTTTPNAGLHVANNVIFQNASDSTTAFQLLNSTGESLLNADTSGSKITLNSVGAYSDEFNSGGPTAAARWSFVTNDASTYSVNSAAPGKLRIIPADTSAHDCWTGGAPTCLRLVQTPPTGDFQADVKLDTLPPNGSGVYSSLGIIVYKDTTNFLRFELQSYGDGSSWIMKGYKIIANVGSTAVSGTTLTGLTAPFYVRVKRTTDTWTLYYSTDGSSFTTVGSFTQALDLSVAGSKIGPMLDNYPAGTTFAYADFDYFHLTTASATILQVNGGAIFQNGLDSTTAFQIKNAAGTGVLAVDTTNNEVGIGTTGPNATLDIEGNAQNQLFVGVGASSSGNIRFQVINSSSSTASAQIWNAFPNTGGTGACTSSLCHTALSLRLGEKAGNPGLPDRFINFANGIGFITGKVQGNNAGGVAYATTGGDYAEWFKKANVNDQLDYGEIVCTNSDGNVIKCDTDNSNLLGVITDNFAFVGNSGHDDDPNYVLVGLIGQIRITVNNENGVIKPGDLLTYSGTPGVAAKAVKAGFVIGRAIDGGTSGRINAYINPTWYDPDVYLTSTGDFNLVDQTVLNATNSAFTIPHYFTLNDALGNPIDRVGAFAELAVAKLRVGFISAQQISTQALSVTTENVTIGGQSLRNYIVSIVTSIINSTNNNIISPLASIDTVHTNLISPLAQDSNIGIKFENDKLSIVNGNSATASAVSSFDNLGNATFSGQLSAANGQFGGASISGTLRAGKIIASDIEGLNIQASTISANYVTNNYYNSTTSAFPTLLATPSNVSSASSSLFGNIFASNSFINIATYSSELAYVENLNAANAAFSQSLTVFGSTTLSDTSVVGQLSVNGSLILANNSINVLSSDLNLQPLRQGGLSIMAGLFYIDTNGNVTTEGNATVKGTLYANAISPIPGSDLAINLGTNSALTNPSFKINNASGAAVLAINQAGDLIASGTATFGKLNLRGLIAPALAVSPTEVIATGSAGTGEINTGRTQMTINNELVTDKSLIYITPTSTTNQTIFLLRQVPGESFTVGIQNPSLVPVKFNWIIVN